MKTVLTDEQVQDIEQLTGFAKQFRADIVIIGATALLCFIERLDRSTNDVDVAIALDLEDFEGLSRVLRKNRWTQEKGREHISPNGTLVDLLPAGPALRAAKFVLWPESQFRMSLVAFEHVFAHAVAIDFAPKIRFKVAPPVVIALLKINAFVEDPNRRAKDLEDLKLLFRWYEDESGRLFSDEVFTADLEDIEQANALLLGLDLAGIATEEDTSVLQSFMDRFQLDEAELEQSDSDDLFARETARFGRQLRAFRKGLFSQGEPK